MTTASVTIGLPFKSDVTLNTGPVFFQLSQLQPPSLKGSGEPAGQPIQFISRSVANRIPPWDEQGTLFMVGSEKRSHSCKGLAHLVDIPRFVQRLYSHKVIPLHQVSPSPTGCLLSERHSSSAGFLPPADPVTSPVLLPVFSLVKTLSLGPNARPSPRLRLSVCLNAVSPC